MLVFRKWRTGVGYIEKYVVVEKGKDVRRGNDAAQLLVVLSFDFVEIERLRDGGCEFFRLRLYCGRRGERTRWSSMCCSACECMEESK